jgi:hypothetical protein
MWPVGIVHVPPLAGQDGGVGEAEITLFLLRSLLRAERDCEAQRDAAEDESYGPERFVGHDEL